MDMFTFVRAINVFLFVGYNIFALAGYLSGNLRIKLGLRELTA